MATARVTAGALLSTVTNTANTFSNAVNSINDVVLMGSTFINRHRVIQTQQSKLLLETSERRILIDTARTIQTLEEDTDKWVNEGGDLRKEQFNATLARLTTILHPENKA